MSPKRSPININGILLLDKPIGLTSNAALQKIKHLFNAAKAGHSGSLDPLASGMLPICFGEATKFSQFLLDANKIYSVTAELGIKTTTGDAEGEIIAQRDASQIEIKQLNIALKKFIGEIQQIPSMYSALKHQGQPLYKLARQGIEIERPVRTVKIYKLELLTFEKNLFSIEVQCSKGTYIRSLIEDIGEALGCGAYVKTLRRLAVTPYEQQKMFSPGEMEELIKTNKDSLMQFLLPADSAIHHWQEIKLSEVAAFYLRRGQAIIAPSAPTSGWVKLKLMDGSFLGIGEILADGLVAPRRLVSQN